MKENYRAIYHITTISTMSKNLKFKRLNRDAHPTRWVRKIDEEAYFTSVKNKKENNSRPRDALGHK
jgi:hypothetical protein